MDEKLIEQEEVEEKLNLSILENDDDVCVYISSLLNNSDIMFTAIKSGTYSKVLILNTERIYVYNKKDNCFYKSEIIINSEEDYIVLELIDVIDDVVPLFRINVTIVEYGTFTYLWRRYIVFPFYNNLFKWKNKNAN